MSPERIQHSRTTGQSLICFLESRKFALALRRELDHGEEDDLEAEGLWVEHGAVGLDDAGLFEGADAPQAGRRGKPDPAGQLHVGDAAVGLQLFQDGPVYGIKASAHGNSATRRG